MASWRAGRSGLGGNLFEPGTYQAVPARRVLDLLLAHVRDDALEDSGGYDQVNELREALVRRGDGASLQRAAYA
jgi:carboxylate-amine ligase